MAKKNLVSPLWVKILRYSGRILLIVWAGFWIFFGVASAVADVSPDPNANMTGWLVVIIGILLLAGGVVLPWIWERLGGFILLVMGLFILVFFFFVSEFQLNLWMILVALPAFIGGGLSLICWYSNRKRKHVVG